MSLHLQTPQDPAAEPAGEQQPTIVFENVSIAFDERQVLQDVSFTLRRGETKVLLGVAGSGKTLILKLAMGLIRPDSGRIFTLGNEITSMRERDLFSLRRKIGMVFQESALFDSLTVEGNVGYRLSEEHVPPEEIHERVVEALRFVELEHTVKMFPSELSGGMRRRVAIARAVITQPEVLLYDSPTGGLDPVTSTTIIELLVKQRDVYHTSALLVTHRLQDAFTMATHAFNPATNHMEALPKGAAADLNTNFIILRDAHIIFEGNAPDLVHSDDEYIREYLS
jgi:phospholipid/cholesterol/gamma-HCH transport system ATP-binding protein